MPTYEIAALALASLLALFLVLRRPSNVRAWSRDQVLLPSADFVQDETVHIKNVRNIAYRTGEDYDLHYYDTTLMLDDIESVSFMVAPFGPPGAAHTFLLFNFKHDRAIALSIEIRKKARQHFRPIFALLPRYYEIMYVWADERDVVNLRTHIWKYKTYKIKLLVSHESLKKLFAGALRRTNAMASQPEFYNLFTNNCTNNLVNHMREAGVTLPRFSWRYVFPAAIERVLARKGLVLKSETSTTLEEPFATR